MARAQAQAGSFTVVVTITNSGLTLAPSTVPAGSVVFKIVNRAKIARDFEIAGKKTPIIGTGKSATLRVEVKRFSRYFSVGPGHARLSGLLGVLEACAKPTTSTVAVQITFGMITLSQSTVPCGTVTFVVTNKDALIHAFTVYVPTTVGAEVHGPRLRPGATASTMVSFPYKGNVYYFCREYLHNEGQEESRNESGNLTVR